MADKSRIVNTPDGPQAFPPDATDAEISEVLNAVPASKVPPKMPHARTWTDIAVDALPVVGGAVGGVLGAASGIPTLGLTSLPAAAAGATMLGAGGEAAKQLINRYRGAEAPTSATDAALEIGKQGAIQGATTAAVGGAVKGAQVVAPYAIKGAAVVADSLSPDIVGLVSPRIAHGLRIAQKAVALAQKTEPKLTLKAMDVVRVKSLIDQGVSQADALKTVMNLRMKGLL